MAHILFADALILCPDGNDVIYLQCYITAAFFALAAERGNYVIP